MPLYTFYQTRFNLFPGFVFPMARVLVDWVDETLYGLRLELHGELDDWAKVQAEGTFGCSPDQLGPIFGGGFSPKRPIHLTIQLTHEQTMPLSILALSPLDTLARLLLSPPGSSLRSDSSWRLFSVMQPWNNKVSVGLTTCWFSEHLNQSLRVSQLPAQAQPVG